MIKKEKQLVYLEITSKEDEKKWKEFLGHYFPNHYAKDILNRDLVVIQSKERHQSKRIGIDVNGFGWLSSMCLHYGDPELFIQVKDFEEFKETDVYKHIVNTGPSFEEGEPRIIHLRL